MTWVLYRSFSKELPQISIGGADYCSIQGVYSNKNYVYRNNITDLLYLMELINSILSVLF